MVGHHLQRDDLYMRVVAGNAPPLLFHPLAELCELHARRIRRIGGGCTTTKDGTEKGTATFGGHGDHIHHPLRVVVAYTAALHRRLLLAGESFLTFIYFALHRCKDSESIFVRFISCGLFRNFSKFDDKIIRKIFA